MVYKDQIFLGTKQQNPMFLQKQFILQSKTINTQKQKQEREISGLARWEEGMLNGIKGQP